MRLLLCFIVGVREYLVLKIATSPTQAEQSFSFWCLMAQLTIDNLLVEGKNCKFQKSLWVSPDLFSFSYFSSNEIRYHWAIRVFSWEQQLYHILQFVTESLSEVLWQGHQGHSLNENSWGIQFNSSNSNWRFSNLVLETPDLWQVWGAVSRHVYQVTP